jgi:hypothetical protein
MEGRKSVCVCVEEKLLLEESQASKMTMKKTRFVKLEGGVVGI